MKNVFLGRQPILDTHSNLYAYELLYRDAQKQQQKEQTRYTSSYVINNVLNKFGTRSILGERKGFVQIDAKFLMSDIIFSIPTDFFVFSLLTNIPINERVIERVQQLKKNGYTLAINNMQLNLQNIQKYTPIFKELSFVKSKITLEVSIRAIDIIKELKIQEIQIIGACIDNNNIYEYAQKLGCDYFEGYFFAQAKILENVKYEPSQMNILSLYNLLLQDANIDEITLEFEKNPEITVQLLQFINSGYFHFKNRISSIHHVLTLVGRKAIAQWLMLMIYSKSVSKTSQHSPLMLMIINRTSLMENILKAIKPDVKSNMLGEAYMVGILSLIDTLFHMKLEDILDTINISEEVRDALCDLKGLLGEIYSTVLYTEQFDIKAIYLFEKKHSLKYKTVENLVLQSMQEVQRFENPDKD